MIEGWGQFDNNTSRGFFGSKKIFSSGDIDALPFDAASIQTGCTRINDERGILNDEWESGIQNFESQNSE